MERNGRPENADETNFLSEQFFSSSAPAFDSFFPFILFFPLLFASFGPEKSTFQTFRRIQLHAKGRVYILISTNGFALAANVFIHFLPSCVFYYFFYVFEFVPYRGVVPFLHSAQNRFVETFNASLDS